MAQAKGSRGPPNYVHKDLLHRDNVGKEEKFMMINRNEHYQTNPYNFSTLSEKPTEINPYALQKKAKEFTDLKKANKVSIFPESYTDDPVVEAHSNNHVKNSLKWKTLKPHNKTAWPETSGQEIGWFSQNYNSVKPRQSHSHNPFWVTDWGADFVHCHEENPFHLSKGSKK